MHSLISYWHNIFDKDGRSRRWIFGVILASSIVSLGASLILSIDAIEIAKNPNVSLSCNINAVISCGTVAMSPYSSMLGFPNSFLGMMFEPIFVVIAVAGLMKVKFNRQFMFLAQIMAIGALAYAFLLLFISSFVIQVLCPWCLSVTFSTTIMFFALTRYNVLHKNLYLPSKISETLIRWTKNDYDKLLAATIIFLVIAMIFIKYGDSLFI